MSSSRSPTRTVGLASMDGPLHAGLPVKVPGMQLDRRCGGGLQAIATAAMMVQTGAADVVVPGDVESMSGIEYYSTDKLGQAIRVGGVALPARSRTGAFPAARVPRRFRTAKLGVVRSPIAVNQISHASNVRFDQDVETCIRHRAPVIISSLRAPSRRGEGSTNMADPLA